MESLNGKNCRKGFVFDLSIVTFVIPKWSWRMSHRVPCWVGYGSVVLFSKGTFCSRRSPNAAELATIFKLVSTLELKILRYWVLLISNFSFPIVPSWDFSNLNSTYFFSSVRRRKVTSERFGMIFPKYVIMLLNWCSSFAEFGNGIFDIASFFAWKTFRPSDDLIYSRKTMNFTPIWHLFLFSFNPLLWIFKKTLFNCLLCLARVLRHTITLSWELALPGISEIMKVISRWKTLLAEWIP